MPLLTFLQSGVSRGDIVRPSLINLVGLEGLLVKQGGPAVAGAAGYNMAQALLPTAQTDEADFVLLDGGQSSVSPYQNQIRPLQPHQEALLWLNGSATAGDLLVLAPILTRAAVTSPTGGAWTSTAGMVMSVANLPNGANNNIVWGAVTTGAKGAITAIALSGGTYVANGTPVLINDPTGYGFVGVITSAAGVPSAVNILNGGLGYSSPAPVLGQGKYRKVGIAAVTGVDAQLILVNPRSGDYAQ